MKSLTRSAAGLLLMVLCLPSLASASTAPATHEFTLDNGLKLIVREDHRAPVAVSQLWYKVGSSYETPGKTGLSHALEHMMFKGSAKLDQRVTIALPNPDMTPLLKSIPAQYWEYPPQG